MFGLGTPELMIILAISFILFGGKRLPEIGAGLGKGITAFKKGVNEGTAEIDAAKAEAAKDVTPADKDKV